jgi:hypothetical protein
MTARQFIRDYYDKKHPILHRLRANMGVGLDEVEKLLEEYAQQLAPSWVKASELPNPLPDVVFTFIRGKIFSYNTDYNLKGLQEVIKHHPDGWYMGINYPDEQPAQRATDDGELRLLRETIKNQHELIVSGEKRGYEKAKQEAAQRATQEKMTWQEVIHEAFENGNPPLTQYLDQHFEVPKRKK